MPGGPRHLPRRAGEPRRCGGCPRRRTIGHGVGARRNIGSISCVSASRPVDAVTGRRQLQGQLGIDHRQACEHTGAAQAGLDAMLGRSQYGVAGDLASRAGRGGNRDVGHGRCGAAGRGPRLRGNRAARRGCPAWLPGLYRRRWRCHRQWKSPHRTFRRARIPCRGVTSSTVGSPGTGKGNRRNSGGGKRATRASARSGSAPVTTSARRPRAAAAGATSRERTFAEEDAGGGGEFEACHYQTLVRRIDVGVDGPRARLGHHVRDFGGPGW